MTYIQGEKLSNCCNAGVHENTDMCGECKEHCEVVDDLEWLDEDWKPERVTYYTNRSER